jgi:hypothetical protein
MADLPLQQLSAARAVADRAAAFVSAGRVRDTQRVEAYVESLRTAAASRITQAQRDAARARSSKSARSAATQATQRQHQVRRPPLAVL